MAIQLAGLLRCFGAATKSEGKEMAAKGSEGTKNIEPGSDFRLCAF
jgi:hypothetical protein